MRSATLRVLAIVLVWGCSTNKAPDTQSAKLGDLKYEIPIGWRHFDAKVPRYASSEWPPAENGRKGPVEVIRTELSPRLPRAGRAASRKCSSTRNVGSTMQRCLRSRG